MPKSQVVDQEIPPKQGFLLIDKPAGMTSHDVVDRVRRLTGERRVGHSGTLDPFATGLLIVGVGRAATREMHKLVGLDKEYEAVFVLGASSTTDDVEGEITPAPLHHLGMITTPDPSLKRRGVGKSDGLQEVLDQFIGEIEQVPPTYSAIKIGGKKMYEAARAGRPMEAKARRVTIYSLSLRGTSEASNEAISAPGIASSPFDGLKAPRNDTLHVALTIRCSSGTYIRALARDVGRALAGGGYVEALRRTKIGPFTIEEAHALASLQGRTQELLIPVETLLSKL